nr:MAG TPA: hypothetical protein [Caudoviricetes sp.]
MVIRWSVHISFYILAILYCMVVCGTSKPPYSCLNKIRFR